MKGASEIGQLNGKMVLKCPKDVFLSVCCHMSLVTCHMSLLLLCCCCSMVLRLLPTFVSHVKTEKNSVNFGGPATLPTHSVYLIETLFP